MKYLSENEQNPNLKFSTYSRVVFKKLLQTDSLYCRNASWTCLNFSSAARALFVKSKLKESVSTQKKYELK